MVHSLNYQVNSCRKFRDLETSTSPTVNILWGSPFLPVIGSTQGMGHELNLARWSPWEVRFVVFMYFSLTHGERTISRQSHCVAMIRYSYTLWSVVLSAGMPMHSKISLTNPAHLRKHIKENIGARHHADNQAHPLALSGNLSLLNANYFRLCAGLTVNVWLCDTKTS